MKYDGSWKQVAQDIYDQYGGIRLKTVLHLQCEKGYLGYELAKYEIKTTGVETSNYARSYSWNIPTPIAHWPNGEHFDLCLALGLVYTLNLQDAMSCLRRIENIAHASFITLAAYETEEDLRLFRKWTLLGTTILRKEEWLEVLKHCGFTGDYWFVTAQSLKLREA